MSTSGGSARSTSTAATMKKLASAQAQAAHQRGGETGGEPVATITAASCKRDEEPSTIFGAYCAITSQLRKVSPNLPIQRRDELADAQRAPAG